MKREPRRRRLSAAGAASLLLASMVHSGPSSAAQGDPEAEAYADAESPAVVMRGRDLYRSHCANCHGRRLEGQALWALRDQFVHQRAPAHDDSGHTWQHSDRELLEIIRSGRLPGMPEDFISHMPAYAGVLGDGQILAILAFIKSRWSVGVRAAQSMLNPDFRGMPAAAANSTWTFPPNCRTPWEP